MVKSLVLIQSLVQVGLAAAAGPEQVPLMRLGIVEAVHLAETADKLGVALQYLIEQLTVVDVIALRRVMMPIRRCRRRVHQQLVALNHFEVDHVVHASLVLDRLRLDVLEQRDGLDVELAVLVEEVLSCARLTVITRHNQ